MMAGGVSLDSGSILGVNLISTLIDGKKSSYESFQKVISPKNCGGFTLVELVIVVLIIGILVTIAAPVYNASQDNAKLRACQTNQRIVEGAVQQWLAADSTRDITNADALNAAEVKTLLVSQIKDEPTCPSAGTFKLTNGVVTCSEHAHY